mmetsp:Transcript_4391/g.11349  ORF Transcript_4391/g.11349 Transcript_4391/m.11349 type:complete len:214 (-) Transcript_4391:160-801(-)
MVRCHLIRQPDAPALLREVDDGAPLLLHQFHGHLELLATVAPPRPHDLRREALVVHPHENIFLHGAALDALVQHHRLHVDPLEHLLPIAHDTFGALVPVGPHAEQAPLGRHLAVGYANSRTLGILRLAPIIVRLPSLIGFIEPLREEAIDCRSCQHSRRPPPRPVLELRDQAPRQGTRPPVTGRCTPGHFPQPRVRSGLYAPPSQAQAPTPRQ